MCQSCLAAEATEVHHLTWAHVLDEFAWELTSVCKPCWERMHSEDEFGEEAFHKAFSERYISLATKSITEPEETEQ